MSSMQQQQMAAKLQIRNIDRQIRDVGELADGLVDDGVRISYHPFKKPSLLPLDSCGGGGGGGYPTTGGGAPYAGGGYACWPGGGYACWPGGGYAVPGGGYAAEAEPTNSNRSVQVR